MKMRRHLRQAEIVFRPGETVRRATEAKCSRSGIEKNAMAKCWKYRGEKYISGGGEMKPVGDSSCGIIEKPLAASREYQCQWLKG
jgi:hypothetical protein